MRTSVRSLIGLLNADGSYRARSCHEDGFPFHQAESLAESLHRYHDGDAAALFEQILEHDWQRLAPSDSATGRDRETCERTAVATHAGIGYVMTASSPGPVIGTVVEATTEIYAWLYLWDGDQLRVYGNDHYRARWQFYNDVYLTSSSFAEKWSSR